MRLHIVMLLRLRTCLARVDMYVLSASARMRACMHAHKYVYQRVTHASPGTHVAVELADLNSEPKTQKTEPWALIPAP